MSAGVIARLSALEVSPAVGRVADYVRDHPRECLLLTSDEIANRAQVSPSVVIKFVKDLGFRGMQDFRVTLASELGRPTPTIYDEVAEKRSEQGIAATVLSEAAQALLDAVEGLTDPLLESVALSLIRARRIGLYGAGASAYVAEDGAHKLMRLDLPAWAITDPHTQPVFASQLTPDDVVIAISYSGKTTDTVDSAAVARGSGAQVVAITSGLTAPLARVAHTVLPVPAVDAPDTLGAFTSRLVQLAVLDALTVAITMAEPARLSAMRSRAQLLQPRRRS
jgi:RpiR family transcriptional regulator, carbohydrate utilization regulator